MQPALGIKAAKTTHGFHATIKARPGKGEAVLDILKGAPARSHDDCVVFLIGRSSGDQDVIYVTEGWTSREAHARFFNSYAGQACVAALGPLIDGEPRYLDEVPVCGKAAF